MVFQAQKYCDRSAQSDPAHLSFSVYCASTINCSLFSYELVSSMSESAIEQSSAEGAF